jgi:hypothetical protein
MVNNKKVKIWFDKKGDFLEVSFVRKAGHFRETQHDAVMEKVDAKGNAFGFSVLKVSSLSARRPLSVALKSRVA